MNGIREPYVGPRPFGREHEALFFGREREASEVQSLIMAHSVVLLYAQSGAGKTSLLNAGIVPHLINKRGAEVFHGGRVTGDLPEGLEVRNVFMFHLLASLGGESQDPAALAEVTLAGYLARKPRPPHLGAIAPPRVLILDQFEEIFTTTPERWAEREPFFEQIAEALEEDRRLRIVLALREEYIASLDPYEGVLPERLSIRFRLAQLRYESALLAVTEPVRATGHRFDEAIAEKLVKELQQDREFIEPLLLQVAGQHIWNKHVQEAGGTLVSEEYYPGQVTEALGTFYTEALKAAVQDSESKEKDLREWFQTRLITPSKTRATVFQTSHLSVGISDQALDSLCRLHLIRREPRAGGNLYELIHDLFIESILESNRDWFHYEEISKLKFRLEEAQKVDLAFGFCGGLDEALRTCASPGRPFDVIIIGGGLFGSMLAHRLFVLDSQRRHRILLLEAGRFFLHDHVQNLGLLDHRIPIPTSIDDLRRGGGEKPRGVIWGLPWHSPTTFPGVAYCIGGRSLFWSGWALQPIPSEFGENSWPSRVIGSLRAQYFRHAREQLGVAEASDRYQCELHKVLRQRVLEGISNRAIIDAVPLSNWQDPRRHGDHYGNSFKIEAPLAVHPGARGGKFCAVPLLIHAASAAKHEAGDDETKRRVMVVPLCHVVKLVAESNRVASVETNLGRIPIVKNSKVVIALPTIESARLALISFKGIRNHHLIGRNLMAHLSSHLAFRVSRAAFGLSQLAKGAEISAVVVKGLHEFRDGSPGHFHLQITAASLENTDEEAKIELFRKTPDIDNFEDFLKADSQSVVVFIRAIGEMERQNLQGEPRSSVKLDKEKDEFGDLRANVVLKSSQKDEDLWNVMDQAMREAANIIAGGNPEVLREGRDSLGATFHEAGTLWMGDDPRTSVTNPDARFHDVSNTYAVGPAIMPTLGSPSPVLTATALVLRLADHLISSAESV